MGLPDPPAESRDSMMGFVMGSVHANAMSQVSTITSAAGVTNWQLPADQMPPTWAMARAQLLETDNFFQ